MAVNKGRPAEIFVTYQGKTQSIPAWSRIIGLRTDCLRYRLNSGRWDLESAFTTPRNGRIVRPLPSNTRLIAYAGKTQSISAWARELKIPLGTLTSRLKKGWSLEESLQRFVDGKSFNYRMVSYNGKTQHLAAWARELGIEVGILRSRIDRGNFSIEEAFKRPARCGAIGFCTAIDKLHSRDLPTGIDLGYAIYDGEEDLGNIYQIRKSRWSNQFAFNASHPEYSQIWRTRWEAIVDLAKRNAELDQD